MVGGLGAAEHIPLGLEAKPERPALWHWWQKALGSWGQKVAVLPKDAAVGFLGGCDHRRVWALGWGGAVVEVVESDPGIRGPRGGRVWHGLGPALLCPWEGMSSLPLDPCGEETVR